MPAAKGHHRDEEEGCAKEEGRTQGRLIIWPLQGSYLHRWQADSGRKSQQKNNGVYLTPPNPGADRTSV